MRKLMAICIVLGVALSGVALAQNQPFVGETMATGANFCPLGWEPMNGQLLPIAGNDALFQLIGTKFGGDGQTTFALPAVKPVVSATGETFVQCISLFGVFPVQN